MFDQSEAFHVRIRLAGAQVLSDLYEYDITTTIWTQLVGRGDLPSGRYSLGFTALGSRLFLFGGNDGQGDSTCNAVRACH